MAEPTDADRTARTIVSNWLVNFSADQPEALENMIATRLAEERERARAPFAKLVEFYDRHEYSTLNVDELRELLEDPR